MSLNDQKSQLGIFKTQNIKFSSPSHNLLPAVLFSVIWKACGGGGRGGKRFGSLSSIKSWDMAGFLVQHFTAHGTVTSWDSWHKETRFEIIYIFNSNDAKADGSQSKGLRLNTPFEGSCYQKQNTGGAKYSLLQQLGQLPFNISHLTLEISTSFNEISLTNERRIGNRRGKVRFFFGIWGVLF